MINAVMSKLSKMKKEDVEQQLASMDEDELIDEGHDDEKEDKALIAKMMKMKKAEI